MISGYSMVLLAMGDGETAGHFLGAIFVPATLLLLGLAKCYLISLRPTTSRKCVYALSLTLLAMLVVLVRSMSLRYFQGLWEYPVINAFLLLGELTLPIVALVLGIIGLTEYSSVAGKFNQGRKQVIWALGLSGLLFFGASTGFVRTVTGASAHREYKPVAAIPGRTLNFSELNFRFQPPAKPWVQVDLRKINKDSKVSFVRRGPDTYVTIVAEEFGPDSKMDSGLLADLAGARLESMATSTRVTRRTAYQINGLAGILVEREAELHGFQFAYVDWFCATNGFGYQLVGYSLVNDMPKVKAELLQTFNGFDLIDPGRLSRSTRRTFTNDFFSPAHSYSVSVARSSWHEFRNLQEEFPDAEFGAVDENTCFAVVPVYLGNQSMGVEPLAAGLLGTMNIKYAEADFSRRQVFNGDNFEGLELDYQRMLRKTPYNYRLRIIRQGQYGYLLVAWTDLDRNVADPVLTEALARVHIHSSTGMSLMSSQRFTAQDFKTQAYVANGAGLYYFASDEFEKALPFFKVAAGLASEDLDYSKNVLATFSRLSRNQDGLDFFETLPAAMAGKSGLRAYQAYFQSQCGQVAQAVTNYASLFAEKYRDDADFQEYVKLLIDRKEFERALHEITRYLGGGDSVGVRLLTADVYEAMPDYEKAVKFLEKEHNKSPYNATISHKLIRALLDAGKPTEALALCQGGLQTEPNSFLLYNLKGQCEVALRWYREAKASFETAAKLEPNSAAAKNSLDYVSGLLGEGNNVMLNTSIDPVPLPACFTNVQAPAPPDFGKDYGCYYSRASSVLIYNANAEFKQTDYLNIEVLDNAGVSVFSTFETEVDPLGEDICVNEAKVSDAAGKVLAVVKPSDCYLLDRTGTGTATQKKILNVPIAGLQPGCQISLIITRRSTGLKDGFPFFHHTFSQGVPTLLSGLFLWGDSAGLRVEASPQIRREQEKDGLLLSITNPLVARWEPQQVASSKFLPMAWIADARWTWAGVGTNYLGQIKDRLETEEPVARKAKELTVGLLTAEEKISRLSRFVQTNCTYKAIEFGRRARIPNKGADILRNAYGDCKDHALLLQQMLQAAAVPANLALVCSREPMRTNLPSLDQFDHMVVAVPEGDAWKFIDGTAKGADLSKSVPPGLADHWVLVLDPENPRVARISPYSQDDSEVSLKEQMTLTAAGDLCINESVTMSGAYGEMYRAFFQGISQTYRPELLQRVLELTDAEIKNLKLEFLDDPAKPLKMTYAVTVKNQFRYDQTGIAGKLRSGFSRASFAGAVVQHRSSPFEFPIPLCVRSEIDLQVPAGYHIAESGSSTNRFDSRFFQGEARQLAAPDNLRISFQVKRSAGEFGASDYESYREASARVLDAVEPQIVVHSNKS